MSGIKINNDKAVCSAVVLHTFGESSSGLLVGNNSGSKDDEDPIQARDWPSFIRRLRRAVDQYDRSENNSYHISALSIIHGAVTSTQPMALEAIKKFGFQMYGPVKYKKYSHDLYHFVLSCTEFLDLLVKHEKELAAAAPVVDEKPVPKKTVRRPRTTRPAAAR